MIPLHRLNTDQCPSCGAARTLATYDGFLIMRCGECGLATPVPRRAPSADELAEFRCAGGGKRAPHMKRKRWATGRVAKPMNPCETPECTRLASSRFCLPCLRQIRADTGRKWSEAREASRQQEAQQQGGAA